MTRNNYRGANNWQRRKGKEVAKEMELNLVPYLGPFSQTWSDGLQLGQSSSSQVHGGFNMAAPMMFVPQAPGPEQHLPYSRPGPSQNARQSIDQIVGNHYEHLRQVLHARVDKLAQERVAHIISQKDFTINMKDVEIEKSEQKLLSYAGDIDILFRTIKASDIAVRDLKQELKQLTQDESASSDEQSEQAAGPSNQPAVPVGRECKLCNTREATVMIFPCIHFSVCTACDAVCAVCPVCNGRKMLTLDIPNLDK
jgi:hypothetical protein